MWALRCWLWARSSPGSTTRSTVGLNPSWSTSRSFSSWAWPASTFHSRTRSRIAATSHWERVLDLLTFNKNVNLSFFVVHYFLNDFPWFFVFCLFSFISFILSIFHWICRHLCLVRYVRSDPLYALLYHWWRVLGVHWSCFWLAAAHGRYLPAWRRPLRFSHPGTLLSGEMRHLGE